MKLSFGIANDKASYVSKEHSICLFSVAKEAGLNKQQIKPCVPYVIATRPQESVKSLFSYLVYYIFIIYIFILPLCHLPIKKHKEISCTDKKSLY